MWGKKGEREEIFFKNSISLKVYIINLPIYFLVMLGSDVCKLAFFISADCKTLMEKFPLILKHGFT